MDTGDIKSMTDDELIARFGAKVGEKAGELAADCVFHAKIVSGLAGPATGKLMLQEIIDILTIERERLT